MRAQLIITAGVTLLTGMQLNLLSAAPNPAAATVPTAATPATPASPGTVGWKVSGTWRLRGEHWDWFNTPGFQDHYSFLGSLLRVRAVRQDARREVAVEIAQPTLLNLPDHAVAPAPQGQLGLGGSYYAANQRRNDAGIFVKQAYVRWRGGLKLGRFEFNDGLEGASRDATLVWLENNRLQARFLGNYGFSDVQRSFDGAQFVHDRPARNITAVAGRTTRGVFQTDGNGELDVAFAYGAMTWRPAQGEARLFALRYQDGRNGVLKTDNRPAPVRAADHNDIRLNTVGADYLRVMDLPAGRADLLLWGALQNGDWGTQKQRASALAAEVGYQPRNNSWHPWLRAGYFRSSGDSNAADARHETFLQVLPTPRIYARFPWFNQMNNEDRFVQVLLRPNPKWSVRADAHWLRLSDPHDLWYAGGGAFQPGTFGYLGRPAGGSRDLGTLLDVSLDHPFSPALTGTVYLGYVRGGQVVSNIYPTGANAVLGYLELTRKF